MGVRRYTIALAFLLLGSVAPGYAQIKIGQTAGFSGPVAGGVKETADGAKLYIDGVNAHGGIGGRKIELISMDDKFEPKLAAENAQKLIDQDVIALFLTRGTPHAQAIMPLLTQYKIPLIAPSTGAMVLHEPVNPWVFNVRATYQREAERAVQLLGTLGVERMAIVQVDDSFGADAVAGALKGFTGDKKPLVHEKFDRSKPDFGPIMPKIVKADAQAVMFIASGSHVAQGVAELRKAGSAAQVVTLSNNASAGFVKLLKDDARGTIVSQVFPGSRSMSVLMVREANELAKAAKITEVTPAMLEGFAAAKVLVEGLRRAGKDLTRTGLQKALEGLKRYDLGGLELSYGPTDHTGLEYTDLSIVGADGHFHR